MHSKVTVQLQRVTLIYNRTTDNEHPIRLSTIKRGHHMDGATIRARPCAPAMGEFPWRQNSVHHLNPTKSRLGTKSPPPPMFVYARNNSNTHAKDPVVHVRVW